MAYHNMSLGDVEPPPQTKNFNLAADHLGNRPTTSSGGRGRGLAEPPRPSPCWLVLLNEIPGCYTFFRPTLLCQCQGTVLLSLRLSAWGSMRV